MEKCKLCTAVVSLEHVEEFHELEESKELHLAPKLRKACLNSLHSEKMNVGFADSLPNDDTAAALYYDLQKRDSDK